MGIFRFRIDVDSFLQLLNPDRALLARMATAQEVQAEALKAIVAKMNEPDPDPPPARDLGALAERLAAKDAEVQAELDKAQGAPSA